MQMGALSTKHLHHNVRDPSVAEKAPSGGHANVFRGACFIIRGVQIEN